MQTKTEKKQKN